VLQAAVFRLAVPAGLALLAACAGKVVETRLTVPAARYDLVIASDASPFKERLRERLIARFREQGNIAVVDLGSLAGLRVEDVDAVLVLDSCRAWGRHNRTLERFLKRTTDKGKLVVLMTAADPGWRYQPPGVDAITAASRLEDVDALARALSARLDRILDCR
jgi:hypothetical protein